MRMTAEKREVSMLWFWLSVGIVVGSCVAYHFCQKSVPAAVNPMLSLVVTFATAVVVSLLLFPLLLRDGSVAGELGRLNWASVALGLAIVGVDAGYLLLYRSGWAISLGSVFCNAVVALILLPIGTLLFRERLTLSNYAGVVLALLGIYLISRR